MGDSLVMLFGDYRKLMDTISSCKTIEHCNSAENMVESFNLKWNKTDYKDTCKRVQKRTKEEISKKRRYIIYLNENLVGEVLDETSFNIVKANEK